MSLNQLNQLLARIQQRKNQLVGEIGKEVKILNDHQIQVDINMNQLRYSDNTLNGNVSQYLKLRDEMADQSFLENVRPLLDQVPVSNGSSYFQKIDANIGIIADEFLYNSFKDVANFHYVERDNYTHLAGKLDVLIVASAWKGLHGDWKGLGNPNIGKIRRSISKTIDFFRNDGVKIVFYSKEDPTNYDFFVDLAKKCDYVFTTAAEKVPDYQRDCGHDNVFVLEFGVNPNYNNPIGVQPKSELAGAMFAGSWYKKYPHRQKDSRMLFDGVLDAGKPLKIIDRNFHLNLDRHFYPSEYLSYISPSIDHESLQSLLKLYEWIINLNSVKYSQTMFANRVYEIQAMGSLLISNYSLGINNLFPNIFLATDKSEIQAILQQYSEEELYRLRMFGVRQVLRQHTTYHRITYMLEQIGWTGVTIPKRTVAVIVAEKTAAIKQMFDRQSFQEKTLLTVDEAIRIDQTFDYVAFFDEASTYGEYYLEDMIQAFKYTAADYVTKDSYWNGSEKHPGIENNYISHMDNKYRTVFSLDAYALDQLLVDELDITMENGYSADSLEYNIGEASVYQTSPGKKFTVIIPTYNNGLHLYGKCFLSLRRSSMFDDMEIIIVDDGSTDHETRLIIDRLKRQYDNIHTYFYDDGGSGSASRPRNKGIEMATTDYITFLDPDNEAVNDGFAKLYQELEAGSHDMVVGNMLKLDTAEHEFNYYKDVNYYMATTEFDHIDTKAFLDATHFKAQSIQALMVKKDVILNHDLRMVQGAVGQDTLYFHELLIHAHRFKVISDIIHIYYAGVQGSTVNHITEKTFQKYLVMEKARIQFLEENQLLDVYMDKRFNYYFKNWYFKKLDAVEPADATAAEAILVEIYQMYQSARPNKIDAEIKDRMKQLEKVTI